MMAPPIRLFAQLGQRFGCGVVIDPEIRISAASRPGGIRAARLLCDCGKSYEAAIKTLHDGRIISCGCSSRDRIVKHNVDIATHKLSGHPLYKTWLNILSRCENPTNRSYADYGGRGIKICLEWHNVRVFIAWMDANLGPRPDGMTLDRIDNDRGYEPDNLRWATRAVQNANRRTMQKKAA
jgi:hypothetical protein